MADDTNKIAELQQVIDVWWGSSGFKPPVIPGFASGNNDGCVRNPDGFLVASTNGCEGAADVIAALINAEHYRRIGLTVSDDAGDYVTGGVRFQTRQIGDKLEVRVITEGQPAPSTDDHPEPDLDELIEKARLVKMSEDDEEAQRQSFAKGNAAIDQSGRTTEATAETRGDEGFEAWWNSKAVLDTTRHHVRNDRDVALTIWNAARAELLAKVAGVRAELETEYAKPHHRYDYRGGLIHAITIFDLAFPSNPAAGRAD